MALARARQIDAVLVTELSRRGRCTTDLLATLKELEVRWAAVVALNGMTFDLATPHGRMMATVLSGIAEFERELIQERIRSCIAAAKARGKRLGRQPGHRPIRLTATAGQDPVSAEIVRDEPIKDELVPTQNWDVN